MSDIFHGNLLRNFRGPGSSPEHFSVSSDKSEGRYVFSVGFDFFNPLTNKQAGKRLSVGAVTLRYKPENMFLAGIIPGPKEPPLDTINSYWTPLVDYGVKFSRTHDYVDGRIVRCAIVAVICDLPAARKIGGFSTYTHRRFCTHSDTNAAELEKDLNGNIPADAGNAQVQEEDFGSNVLYGNGVGYNDFNTGRWQRRTATECRIWMEKYRTAPTAAQAQRYFDQTGLRWTEFLRLPYFDVSQMVVVDCMHNLFLGLLREHFRSILGFRASATNLSRQPAIELEIQNDPENPIPTKRKNDEGDVYRAIKSLRRRVSENPPDKLYITLNNYNKSSIMYIAKGLLCPVKPTMTRKQIAALLVKWGDMEALWDDISRIVKPSWVTSLPAKVGGSAGGGKLKADQWRVLGTIYMPLTLGRLWANSDPLSKQRRLLDLTMDLVSSVILAASRETSVAVAEAYHRHMLSYRIGLQNLFPHYECHPNHHMALHITECLLLYGPVHGWWTFPFERLIGALERIPTNYRPGK
ncbi:hypothetical protein C8R46DRAFT_1160842 [Mycena filopes]|nr:hypothetical protein C8R46DRAFT_1160842 [Mycena filopes]